MSKVASRLLDMPALYNSIAENYIIISVDIKTLTIYYKQKD